MSLQVKIIEDQKGMQDFLELPHRLYRIDDQWIPPLQSEVRRTLDVSKNPYFEGCDLQKFVCYDGSEPVARAISVINPRHWKKFGCKTAFFGFFESENDNHVTATLFDAVSEHCRRQGATHLEGPFNPNHYSELGLLVENFTQPVFFETYNPPWYQVLLKNAGFETLCRLHTRRNLDLRGYMAEHPPRVMTPEQTRGYTMRPFNLLRWKYDLECIREVFNEAFAENWHFLPLSRREYDFSAGGMFLVSRPNLNWIVEYQGKPVGVMECVMNINPLLKTLNGKLQPADLLRLWIQRRAIREIVIYAVGIKKTFTQGPVFRMLHTAMGQIAQRYPVVYGTWMTEENVTATNATGIIGMEPYKWFEIFEKPV